MKRLPAFFLTAFLAAATAATANAAYNKPEAEPESRFDCFPDGLRLDPVAAPQEKGGEKLQMFRLHGKIDVPVAGYTYKLEFPYPALDGMLTGNLVLTGGAGPADAEGKPADAKEMAIDHRFETGADLYSLTLLVDKGFTWGNFEFVCALRSDAQQYP